MARKTFLLGVGALASNSITWDLPDAVDFDIPPELVEGGVADRLSYWRVTSGGVSELRTRNGNDLVSIFENSGGVAFNVYRSGFRGRILRSRYELTPPNYPDNVQHDTTEPYVWDWTNNSPDQHLSSAIEDYTDNSGQRGLTELVLDSGEPYFENNQGEFQNWVSGIAIAAVQVPNAGTNVFMFPAISYAVVGNLPAGLNFDDTTRRITGTPSGVGARDGTITVRATNTHGTHDWTVDYRIQTLDVDATFDGDIDGDLSSQAALGDAPNLSVGATFTGDLAGDLIVGVSLGSAPQPIVDVAIDGDLDGDLSAAVALEAVSAGSSFFLGENPFENNSAWEGARLLDPVFVEGGGSAYLRSIQNFGGNVRFTFSVTATGDAEDEGPALISAWRRYSGALTFTSDDGDITIAGPSFSGNTFSDPDEPYFWIPSNSAAFNAWALAEPRNVHVRFNFPPVVVNEAFDGDLNGALASNVALGISPFVDVSAVFDGDLDGALVSRVHLGESPITEINLAIDGGLTGSMIAGVFLAGVPPLAIGATFMGDIDGDLVARLQLDDPPGLDINVALDGDLLGNLVAGAVLSEPPGLEIAAAIDGDLTGSLLATVALGPTIPLRIDAFFSGDLSGALLSLVQEPRFTILWPSNLPRTFLERGYQQGVLDNRHRFSADLGAPMRRPKYSVSQKTFTGIMRMTEEQWDRLEDFYDQDLNGGARVFDFPRPLASGNVSVYFTRVPFRSRAGASYDVSISLATE